jgi:hypothetical protein
MQVAAFEAGLQAMCFLYPQEVKRTTVYEKNGSGASITALWSFLCISSST